MCDAWVKLRAVTSGWFSASAATYCRMAFFQPKCCSSLNSLAGVLELLGLQETLYLGC